MPPESQAHAGLDRLLTRQLKNGGIKDPPTKREKATPLDIVQSIVAMGASISNPNTRHISDLVQLGFYFYLRSCKCTKHMGRHRKNKFRLLLEFMLFVGHHILPADFPTEHLQNATQIVLTLDNQKNAIRGKTVSHFRSESPAACPVLAGVNMFLRIQEHRHPETTPASDYTTDQGLCLVSA